MPIPSRTLKASAKQAMHAAVPSAILITLVYFLLTDVLSNVISFFLPDVSTEALIYDQSFGVWAALFLSVLLILYRAVIGYGYSAWSLHTARHQQSSYGSLMDGFGMPGRVLGMDVLIWLRVLLWTMLGAMVYSTFLVPLLLTVFIRMFGDTGLLIALPVSLLVFYLFIIVVSLRYTLAPYLLCDYPDVGCGAAVRRSSEMLRGRIWTLVKLHLAFWPWYLIEFLIRLGATLVVIVPVMQTILQSSIMDYATIQSMLQQAASGLKTSLLIMLLSLPVELFFRPYLSISVANFYRTLSGEPLERSAAEPNF